MTFGFHRQCGGWSVYRWDGAQARDLTAEAGGPRPLTIEDARAWARRWAQEHGEPYAETDDGGRLCLIEGLAAAVSRGDFASAAQISVALARQSDRAEAAGLVEIGILALARWRDELAANTTSRPALRLVPGGKGEAARP